MAKSIRYGAPRRRLDFPSRLKLKTYSQMSQTGAMWLVSRALLKLQTVPSIPA